MKFFVLIIKVHDIQLISHGFLKNYHITLSKLSPSLLIVLFYFVLWGKPAFPDSDTRFLWEDADIASSISPQGILLLLRGQRQPV